MTNGSGDMTAAFATALESASAEPSATEVTPASETPATDSTATVTAPADATVQPAATETEPVTASATAEEKKGPPQWRWQEMREQTRQEADAAGYGRAKQEYESRVAEYENERRGYQVLTAALNGDAQALAMVAQADPQLAARIRGEQRSPSEPEPEPQPDAAIQLADGSTVPVFTPEGMKKREAWLQKQLASSLEQKFAPLMTTAERLKAAEDQARMQAETQQWAARVLAPVQRLPHFADFKPEILKALQELPPTHSGPLEEVVYATYERLLTAKLAQSTKDAEAHAQASLQQRAVAGTTHPNAGTVTTPPKFSPGVQGFAEALRYHSGSEAR